MTNFQNSFTDGHWRQFGKKPSVNVQPPHLQDVAALPLAKLSFSFSSRDIAATSQNIRPELSG